MKKIALSLAVVATLAMVSCGNKAENTDTDTAANTVDTTMVAPETVVADTDSNKADEAKVEEAAAPAKDSAKANETKTEEPKTK